MAKKHFTISYRADVLTVETQLKVKKEVSQALGRDIPLSAIIRCCYRFIHDHPQVYCTLVKTILIYIKEEEGMF